MKKRPNRRPRYGAISDSTCKENSVSASSKPARNAPSAIDSPAYSQRMQKRKPKKKREDKQMKYYFSNLLKKNLRACKAVPWQ